MSMFEERKQSTYEQMKEMEKKLDEFIESDDLEESDKQAAFRTKIIVFYLDIIRRQLCDIVGNTEECKTILSNIWDNMPGESD